MRVAFLGTPEVAVPALDALVAAGDVEVAVVLTNPDRPKGRSRTPVAPPVKQAALAHGLEVWQPAKPSEVLDEFAALQVDACAVVAYGALLPKRFLEAGGRGFVNLHFSLLPRWRGAAPVQHALRAGDERTGITTFVLDEGMDTGPILDRVVVPIDPDESAGDLLARLARLGAPVLVDSIRRLVAGEEPVAQPAEGATLAPKITPDDVRIDWRAPARAVVDLVRSADPAPGAHTTWRGRRLKVLATRATDTTGEPGTVVARTGEGVEVAAGDGAVLLRRVQPEGKAAMDGVAFANGYRPEPGERLGEYAS
ncbi:methionyl-tRNA formyltransferase [Egicoccus sp. AB-alg2]|uniref:methionyl-tRNA formyltransferase n=1 Tax=Egicoccus sp. AB-alg2 TaxID=3242693 RepID=UPI00359D5316